MLDDRTKGLQSMAESPEAVQLKGEFDVERLQAELVQLGGDRWTAQRTMTQDGHLSKPAENDWKCLPLRSSGGDMNRTDPGGPGSEGYKFTVLIQQAPYIKDVLSSLPAELRSVRLMSLAPSAVVPEHRDTPTGFRYGYLRLHIPIQTNSNAILLVDGVEHCWQPGTLWYADFSRPHSVVNKGDKPRVHLVVDCAITPELLCLFPDHFLGTLPMSMVVFQRTEIPLQLFELQHFEGQLNVPASFLRLDEVMRESDEPDLRVQILTAEGSLVMETAEGFRYGLVHVGGGEFRLRGWIEERGMYLSPSSDGVRACFYTRCGYRRDYVYRSLSSGRDL